MSRFGYLWMLFSVVLSLGVVAYDGHQRDQDIARATKGALYTGVKAGCDRDNEIRQQIRLHENPCDKLARQLVESYLHSSR